MKSIGNKSLKILLLFILLSLLSAGCGGTGGADSKQNTITVSGAWALYPLMITWGGEYQALHPDIFIDISAGGAGKGLADALAGAVDIGMVSRAIAPEEEANGAFWVSVTRDAVFPTINAENPVLEELMKTGLSREVLRGIFITGEITTWGQVTGDPANIETIHVFTRSDACGAAATWAEYLGGTQEELKGVGVYGDPGLLDAVIKDPYAIGFNNLNYIFDTQTGQFLPGARILPLDENENGLADENETYINKDQARQAVNSGDYPAPPSRDLNLVTNGVPAGLVSDFITWILTDGQAYVEEAGYVPLSEEQLEAQISKLNP